METMTPEQQAEWRKEYFERSEMMEAARTREIAALTTEQATRIMTSLEVPIEALQVSVHLRLDRATTPIQEVEANQIHSLGKIMDAAAAVR